MSRVDWLDWLTRLRVAWADADGVSRDMLRPLRRRELGPVLHAQNYGEAADKIRGLLRDPPELPPASGGEPPPAVH